MIEVSPSGSSDSSSEGSHSEDRVSSLQPDKTGALIVGGGPAGLATAVALRLRGIDCTVVEARAPGIDKACGEGLMPDALECLAKLGVNLSESEGHRFRGILFENSVHSVDARFPHGAGLGIRRPQLHRLFTRRAEEAGVQLLWSSRIQLPPANSDADPRAFHSATVNGQPMRFRWLIGADGQSSSVRRWAGLDRVRKQSVRYGFRTHYRVAPWSEFVEIHWGRRGQLYITPVASDCVCVVYITRNAGCDRASILEEFPAVARRLRHTSPQPEIVSQQRGAISATCRLHRVANHFVALVGDASGSADAVTGEGLAMSFRQAQALAASIDFGSLAPYRRAHRRIARLPQSMGALMLTLDRWSAFEVRAMRVLASNPAVFQDLLSVHVGEKSVASVLLRRAPRFGWTLLRNEVVA